MTKSLTKEQMDERFIEWVTFYRRNIHRFIVHYFGMTNLNTFQLIWLYLMNICTTICIVACRGIGKSYLIAEFACAKAVLYPKSKIVIASSTKKQASLIVTEKIQKELMPSSKNLRTEIKTIRTNVNSTEVIFHNGSTIVVVPATENARGFRATCIIYEEFRMIKKEVIDTVLQPFLIVRPANYLNKPEYEHLAEEPMEIYISSAWIKGHWMWETMKDFTKSMLKKGDTYILGFDYCVSLKHNLKTFNVMKKAKRTTDSMSFTLEYENIMLGEDENAFYTFDLLDRNQTMKKPFYPRTAHDVINQNKNKFNIPKQKGEIRVLSVDIAMVVRKGNDNTVITCTRALPSGDYYERQIPYIEAFNGGNTTIQATRIKEIFYDFEADVCVLDTQNAGLAVSDELGKITYSEERDKEYEAWICFNDENVADRINNKLANPVLFSFKGSADLNHWLHVYMKDALQKNHIKFLVNQTKSRDYLESKKEYVKASPLEQSKLDQPYIQTDLTVKEMISLTQPSNVNMQKIKLVEPSTGTKDRYISTAMGNYYIKLLELKLNNNKKEKISVNKLFKFKKPNLRKR